MEEQKVVKKNNTPIILIGLAVLLILTGIGLIVTGNNKSFFDNDKGKEKEQNTEVEPDQPTEVDDDSQRGIIPNVITEDEVLQLITITKEMQFPNETWHVQYVNIIGHDEKNEKFLVSYGEVNEEASVVEKQTIVSVLNGSKNVELPGWIEGQRDLTVYNFIMDELVEPSTDQTTPTDPTMPVDPIDPTVPAEPVEPSTDPTIPDDQAVQLEPVQPQEPVVDSQQEIVRDVPTNYEQPDVQ